MGVATMLLTVWVLVVSLAIPQSSAQTEGDTGYDYNDAYDDDYDDDSVLGLEPQFDVPIVNVTVVAGQVAVLPCSIEYLGKYKVSWIDHQLIPLTYEDRRVVDDPRFSIVRPYIKEWNLRIQEVQWADQGQYRCTVNTVPVKSKIIQLYVKVPAQIIDELSSDDVTVQEGDTVVLVCNVTGVPRPDVTWYRRPANSKVTEKEMIVPGQTPTSQSSHLPLFTGIGLKGEMIIIQNVSRYCDDMYECVADNGVPPAVSRQMRVTVEFPPEIRMPNKRISQHRGKDTILECIITAFPHAVNYWEKDEKRLTSSIKHRIEAYDEGDHTITLSLRVHEINDDDYGEYRCVAANALGRDEESMWLYEYVAPHTPKHSVETTRHVMTYNPGTPSPTQPNVEYKHPHMKNNKEFPNKVDKGQENNPNPKNSVPANSRVTGGGCHMNRYTSLLWVTSLYTTAFSIWRHLV